MSTHVIGLAGPKAPASTGTSAGSSGFSGEPPFWRHGVDLKGSATSLIPNSFDYAFVRARQLDGTWSTKGQCCHPVPSDVDAFCNVQQFTIQIIRYRMKFVCTGECHCERQFGPPGNSGRSKWWGTALCATGDPQGQDQRRRARQRSPQHRCASVSRTHTKQRNLSPETSQHQCWPCGSFGCVGAAMLTKPPPRTTRP
jgi:hypothetical protein